MMQLNLMIIGQVKKELLWSRIWCQSCEALVMVVVVYEK